MNRPTRYFVLLALGSAALAGCGPKWHVLAQAVPDPFAGQNRFGVLPIDYTGLRVGEKTEPEYLAEKDAEQRSSWDGDKHGMNEEYAKGIIEKGHDLNLNVVLASGPDAAPFMIRPLVQFIEPGFYAGVASGASEVDMIVTVTAPDGRILDQIATKHRSSGMSTGQRVRHDANALGEITAEYLKTRVGGPS